MIYSLIKAFLCSSVVLGAALAAAAPAISLSGRVYSVDDLARDRQGEFYELEHKKFELIRQVAEEKYLDDYFALLAARQHIAAEDARRKYLAEKTQVSDLEISAAIERFKEHPNLKTLSEKERQRIVSEYLSQTKERDVLAKLLSDAIGKRQLQVLYPEPAEPIYALSVVATDPVRYGPSGHEEATDCRGDNCPITVVEYSDFECPFCGRAQAAAQEILAKYRGRIRWIVRDMPLEMHPHARPAAIAAHCASDQNRYWPMYDELFRSQQKLTEDDLTRMARQAGVNEKIYAACIAHPDLALKTIAANVRGGAKLGVSGTPTYFVNGRRASGALSFESFRELIEHTLAAK